jgi:outer membrane protein TolC
MRENREKLSIQFVALELAERRVRSTDLLLQSGRAEIRDVLDAQDALLDAQNALLSAVTGYRIGELELQESLGVLRGSADGSWREYDFASPSDEPAPEENPAS